MHTSLRPLALLALAACGSRTPLDDYGWQPTVPPVEDGGLLADDADAAPPPSFLDVSTPDVEIPEVNPDTLSPFSLGQCFGSVTATPNVTCVPSGGMMGNACIGTLDCDGHELLMTCIDGVCTCENPGFNDTCYCQPPEDGTCSPVANCCWR
jgi:hypothetical protein